MILPVILFMVQVKELEICLEFGTVLAMSSLTLMKNMPMVPPFPLLVAKRTFIFLLLDMFFVALLLWFCCSWICFLFFSGSVFFFVPQEKNRLLLIAQHSLHPPFCHDVTSLRLSLYCPSLIANSHSSTDSSIVPLSFRADLSFF